MAVAKVTLNGTTLMDNTDATASADKILNTYTAYIKDGTKAVGTLVPASAPTLQSKTKSYTPTETAQSETVTADSGYDGLSQVSVSVGAISSTYVGTGITRRTDEDMRQTGSMVIAPKGYYESSSTLIVSSGDLASPSIELNSTTGVVTATNTVSVNGYVTSTMNKSNSMTLSTQAAKAVTPSTTTQTAVEAGKFTLGAVTVNPIPSQYIIPSGTKSITANGTGIDVASYASVDVAVPSQSPSLQAKTHITPTESSQTITADSGYDGLSSVQIDAIDSTYVGTEVTRRTSSDLTASGATVTAPAGYYESSVSKSVATGSAGTPTASKGTVSNHAISVTPSVTNTTGYITGGTKTGTAVSVSASELVSGTLSITSSGTKDVTNYASASVAAGTEGTPSATKGSVSNHSISVTPSVTNSSGFISGGTKTGTAVTVSASELVSGTLSIAENGTQNVTNYASVNVAIPIVTYYTGSSAPSSSTGSNGDIYLQTA